MEATTENGVHPKMFEGKGEAVADVALTVAKSIGFAGGVAVNGAALGANVAIKAASETSETAVKAGTLTFVTSVYPGKYSFSQTSVTRFNYELLQFLIAYFEFFPTGEQAVRYVSAFDAIEALDKTEVNNSHFFVNFVLI